MEKEKTAKKHALLNQIESGTMKGNKIKILKYGISAKVFTYQDVMFRTGISETNVTARLSDLEDYGFFKKTETIDTKGGRFSLFTYISDPVRQAEHADKRFKEGFRRWVNNAVKYAELADVTLKSVN